MSIEEVRLLILKSKNRNPPTFINAIFKSMDKNFSNTVDFDEFVDGMHNIGMDTSNKIEMRQLFNDFIVAGGEHININKNDYISFAGFVRAVRPEIPLCRLNIILDIFHKLDVNKDGILSIEDFRHIFKKQAKNHKKYLTGEWSIDQVYF
jgi:Ca2+-binding EF-hand superfamily protein